MTERKLINFLEDFGVAYREMPEKASELVKHFKEISIEENIFSAWVITHPISYQYPPSKDDILDINNLAYTQRVLKFYINLVDDEKNPIYEDLFGYYSELLGRSCDAIKMKYLHERTEERSKICYKSFRINSDNTFKDNSNDNSINLNDNSINLNDKTLTLDSLTLDITIGLMANLDNVGLATWDAGFYLAEYLASNPSIFDDKRIIELGAGIGLTSIVLCKLCLPKKVIVTDYTTEIMENIYNNFRINKVKISKMDNEKVDDNFINNNSNNLTTNNNSGNNNNSSHKEVEIMEFDWEKSFDYYSSLNDIDIIMVADCVYDNGLSIALVSVLARLLSIRNKSNNLPVAYVASTVRNNNTFQFFLDQLSNHNIDHQYVSIELDSMKKLFNYSRTNIVLSLLTLNCSNGGGGNDKSGGNNANNKDEQ